MLVCWKNKYLDIMSEYDLYTRILAPKLKPKNQKVLTEQTGRKMQKADISSDGKICYTVYRYDQGEQREQFFPFFNNTHDGDMGKAETPSPEGLLRFCDYILLAERNNRLYVLLIELKSGANGDAIKQLDATATFMDYVKNTAIRIAEENGYQNFNVENVKVRKIVLKPINTKSTTNVIKSLKEQLGMDATTIYFSSIKFPLRLFLQ